MYPLVFCAEPRHTQRPCCERANSALESRRALKRGFSLLKLFYWVWSQEHKYQHAWHLHKEWPKSKICHQSIYSQTRKRRWNASTWTACVALQWVFNVKVISRLALLEDTGSMLAIPTQVWPPGCEGSDQTPANSRDSKSDQKCSCPLAIQKYKERCSANLHPRSTRPISTKWIQMRNCFCLFCHILVSVHVPCVMLRTFWEINNYGILNSCVLYVGYIPY